MNGNSNNLLAFTGGFIGAMTHYITNLQILLNLKLDELIDFTVHSLIGGAIMLAVKVLGDWIMHKIKNPKNNKPEDSNNSNE